MRSRGRRHEYVGAAREIGQLGTPILIAGLSEVITGVSDVALMGHFSVDGLAAVAAGAAIFGIGSNVVVASTVGHDILAAQRYGQGSAKSVGSSLLHTLAWTFGLALLIALAFVQFGTPMLSTIAPSETVSGPAYTYLIIRTGALPLLVVSALLRGTFDARKETRWGMKAGLLANALNIIGDVFLIYGLGPFPRLGEAGNALGSLLGSSTAALYLLWVAMRVDLWRDLGLKSVKPRWLELKRSLSMGTPAIGSNALDHLGTVVMFGFIGQLGGVALAGGRVAFNILIIAFVVVASLAHGGQILMARAVGAGNERQLRTVRGAALAVLVAGSVPAAALLALLTRPILQVYTPFRDVTAEATVAVLLVAASLPLMAFTYGAVATLRAIGRTDLDMVSNVAAVWLVQVPIAWLVGLQLEKGLAGIFVGFLCYWLGRGILAHRFAAARLAIAEYPASASAG